MRALLIALAVAGISVIAVAMSLITYSSAWAGPTVVQCFGCANGGGGECAPTEHMDGSSGTLYQGGTEHSGCSEQSCDAKHTWYSLSFADPAVYRPEEVKEAQSLVARVLRAVHNHDIDDLAEMTREDPRVQINAERGAVQVFLRDKVVAHALLPGEVVAGVLEQH